MTSETELSRSIGEMLDRPEVRRAHADRFLGHGLPTVRNENWKYTSLRVLDGQALRPAERVELALAPEDLAEFALPPLDAWRVTLVDGWLSRELSVLDGLPAGCRITALSEEQSLPDWAQEDLDHDFETPDLSLAALNGAMAREGLLIEIGDGVQLDRPLHCLQLSLAADQPQLVNLRHLLRMGEGSSLTLIEQFATTEDAAQVTNVVMQMSLAASARLDHIRLQQEGDHSSLITRSMIRQARNSHYAYSGFDLGGRLVRHDLSCRLEGEGAFCGLNGVYALNGQRHVDNHTRVDHVAPRARSSELFKGVLNDRTRGVFNGKVVVHPGADGTDAQQTNGNLLLSQRAEVDTKPELEIYADDVKCSHGATIGRLDDGQLFYLRSRGIDEQQARLMLTEAFCREVVDGVEPDSLHDYLAAQIIARLPKSDVLEEPS
jgi:Fe-S cluster assembly protein SufD